MLCQRTSSSPIDQKLPPSSGMTQNLSQPVLSSPSHNQKSPPLSAPHLINLPWVPVGSITNSSNGLSKLVWIVSLRFSMLLSHLGTICGTRLLLLFSPNPTNRTTPSRKPTDLSASWSAVGNSWRKSLQSGSSLTLMTTTSSPQPSLAHMTIIARLMLPYVLPTKPKLQLSAASSPQSSSSISKVSLITLTLTVPSTFSRTLASLRPFANGLGPSYLTDKCSFPSTASNLTPSTLTTAPHKVPPSPLSYQPFILPPSSKLSTPLGNVEASICTLMTALSLAVPNSTLHPPA